MTLQVVLASGSASRRAVLAAAGVTAEAVAPNVDEESFRSAMRSEGLPVRDQAMRLAEMKAVRVSQSRAGLVIGGDQMLALGDEAFDKPRDLVEAKSHLTRLSGQSHTLETAIVVCEGGVPVWRHLARPKLTMRTLSPEFIETYVAQCGDALLSTVGAYQLESLGAQLFSRIDGDFFSVLGLPLLPLLDYLRIRKVLAQ
ncbi:Maf family protein [Hyphomonas sp.]|uniref:Maf family protein n=1 Tax=Hyphomonas sp. TaxID=87 RepID=UPI00391D093C